MKFRCFIIFWILASSYGWSQNMKELHTESLLGYRVKKFYRNDTLLIRCDTVFLMNPGTFRIYDGLYNKNPLIKETVNQTIKNYEEQIQFQDSERKKLENELLKSIAEYENYRKLTEKNQQQLRIELEETGKKLEASNLSIEEFQNQLKRQRRQAVGGKIVWTLGGICAGMIIMSVLN